MLFSKACPNLHSMRNSTSMGIAHKQAIKLFAWLKTQDLLSLNSLNITCGQNV